jgi:MFS family permease
MSVSIAAELPRENPAERGAWAGAAVLCAAALFCGADITLPMLLVEPIKAAFGLTDTQVALLTGSSFATSMAVFALPLSWIADRFNRATLLTVAIAVWCGLTMFSGFATGFWSLFVLRLGVGLGEAALKPAAISLLGDLFPPKAQAAPLGAFAVLSMLGPVAAMSGGGLVYDAISHAAAAHALPIAPADAWRWTTAGFGALGLLVAVAAAFLLRDPRQGRAETAASTPAPARISFLGYLRASAFFYVPYIVAMVAFVLWQAGFMGWLAPFFSRSYGWSVGRIGQAVGAMNLAAGLLGAPLGVWMSAVLSRRLGRDAPVAVTWVALAVTAPLLVIGPLLPNGWLALGAFSLMFTAAGAATVVTPMVFTTTAPPHLRARMYAVSNLFFGLVGQSTGGVIFAQFTERVAGGPSNLRITFSVMSAVFMAICVAALVISDRRYAAAEALAQREA